MVGAGVVECLANFASSEVTVDIFDGLRNSWEQDLKIGLRGTSTRRLFCYGNVEEHGSVLSVEVMRGERARKLEGAGRGGTGCAGSAASPCLRPACV
jgi:hypothetical protein